MRMRLPAYLAVLFGLAACAGGDLVQTPTDPSGPNVGKPQLASAVYNPNCTAADSATIAAEIDALFIKNNWPDANSAQGKFKNVNQLLDAGDIDGARLATQNLVGFIANKFGHLTQAEQANSQSDYDQLVSDLWCFVGISGLVFDLNPGDTAKAFDIPGVGGVYFPADVVPVGTIVSVTDLSGKACPLSTILDCYEGFLDIALYPSTTLSQLATVVLCPPFGVPTDSLRVGHQGFTGFEILPWADTPPLLANTCSGSTSSLQPREAGWLASLWREAKEFMLPQPLQASTFMFVGGVGGSLGTFSPLGIVGVDLLGSAGGVGGSSGTFTPPALSRSNTSASTAPALSPTGLGSYIGQAGDTVTDANSLPSVTVKTLGGDANGANPVPGVAVTFTTGPAQYYDPDSQAKVCDGAGTVSDTVQVFTDAQGVAKLPCLYYGTKVGYANLKATFDPTSLNIPGGYQITVNGSTSSSFNWLVETQPGPAASINTYMVIPPATTPTASPSYSYGTNLTWPDGTPWIVSPAAKVLVTDAFGNPVGAGQTVFWTANTTNGAVLTVGGGGTTDALGAAQVTSWELGDGANDLKARLTDDDQDPLWAAYAQFTASTPTGISVFACTADPSSKTDLGPMVIKAPKATTKTVTIKMTINGTSNALSNYPATLTAYEDGQSVPLKQTDGSDAIATGTVELPGDNGKPVSVSFRFPSRIPKLSGNASIRFVLDVTTPDNRKPQVWYNASKLKSNDPCYGSLVYDPVNLTQFKRGLWIEVTN